VEREEERWGASYQPSPNRPEVHIISSVTIGLLVIVVHSFLIFIQVVEKGNKRKEDEGKYMAEERDTDDWTAGSITGSCTLTG
jgi:hypothetical protein